MSFIQKNKKKGQTTGGLGFSLARKSVILLTVFSLYYLFFQVKPLPLGKRHAQLIQSVLYQALSGSQRKYIAKFF